MCMLLLFLLLSSILSSCDEKINISNEADLQKLRECPDSSFTFLRDVVVTMPFTPIPAFTGAIDGQNYKLTIPEIVPTDGLMGVFQSFSGAIKRLYLVAAINDLHERTEKVGLFTGECNNISIFDLRIFGTISCKTKLSSTTSHYVGGFVGHAKSIGSHIDVQVNISINTVVPNLFVGGAIGLLADTSINAPTRNVLIRDITYSGNIFIKPSEHLNSPNTTLAETGTIYVGGVVAKSDFAIINLAVFNINVDIWASSLSVLYGGLTAVHSKSLMSSFVKGGHVIIEQSGDNSCIGGAIGSLESNCPDCVNVENCQAEYEFFEVLGSTKGAAGFVGCSLYGNYSRCMGSYTDIRLVVPAGGFIAIAENVNISECAFIASNYTTIKQTILGVGGFAGTIKLGGVINNSYVYIKNFTINSTGNRHGGFVGYLFNSVVDNCFIQVENATLFISTDKLIKIGFFAGYLQQMDTKTYISHSYCKISKFNYKMITEHNIALGGFISEVINVQDTGTQIGYCLYSSWMDVSIYLDFDLNQRRSRTCIVGAVHDAKTGLSIDNFYGRLYVESNIISFAFSQGFFVVAHLVFVQKLRLEHVIFNFTHNYVGDPDTTPSEIQIIGTSLTCTWCTTLVIAKNKYLKQGSTNLYDPDEIRSESLYSGLNWLLGETQNWTMRGQNCTPVLTGLPYILRKYEITKNIISSAPYPDKTQMGLRIPDDDADDVDPSGYTFYFPTCKLSTCWDYTGVWDSSHVVGHGELIWTTRKCLVSLCSLCKEDSQFFCETCAGGRITQQGQCQLCQEGCISCPESIDKCVKCADPNYDVKDGKCVEMNTCLSKPMCMSCDKDDRSLCKRCMRRYWLNSETNDCEPCPSTCDVCSSANECLQCSVSGMLPIAGSCDYSSTCADTQTCLYCRSNQPTFCLVCNDNSLTPNDNGICVSTDILHCHVSRCLLCLPNNPYWCDTCESGSYVSSIYGVCMHCETDCGECTELECITCKDSKKLPIDGICSYKSDCKTPHCKFCTNTVYSQCLQCVDRYTYDPIKDVCIAHKSIQTQAIYVSIFVVACLFVVGLTLAFCITRVRKFIKQSVKTSEEVKPLFIKSDNPQLQESMAISREFYTPVGMLRESMQEVTE